MCDSELKEVTTEFRKFKEESTMFMSSMSGIVLAILIALILKIACDCRKNNEEEERTQTNEHVEIRPKSANLSNRISIRKFSEAFKFHPTNFSRNSLDSEFSVTTKKSKEESTYDNIRANDNLYDHPKSLHAQISVNDGTYETVDDINKNLSEMNQGFYQNNDLVITASDPENIYDTLDIKDDIYDEIDPEDLKDFIASKIYDELPKNLPADQDMKIAIDKKKSKTLPQKCVPPKLPSKNQNVEISGRINDEYFKTSFRKNVSNEPKFNPNEDPRSSKFSCNQQPYIEREDEDVLYMSLDEIRQRGYVKMNKQKINEVFGKNFHNKNCKMLQNNIIIILSVIIVILIIILLITCCWKKKQINLRSKYSWDPNLKPNRSSIRRNSAFFDESLEQRQAGNRNSVTFEMEPIDSNKPENAPRRDSRAAKREYIRQQTTEEDDIFYTQPCDSINGKTFDSIVNNALYDELPCSQAKEEKIVYAEIKHEGTRNANPVAEENKKPVENLIYAELDLLKTVNKK
ncbi:hypothetical protein PVAND_015390 [Polypedilum vanderplanki]|uniref:Uncharacterized protein n=1 Tax=Polypedilum vanderplanki TaxID=319348 RepID=A0A9J6BC15_POLVA|nr:hypothetical protein PVAND_015390 [Polypedilum vanderplanki]